MIGIDVGGANVKIVDDHGVHIHYCPLWEHAPITAQLDTYASLPDDGAVVVMSGELADCFSHKMEGISFIVDAVKKAFPHARFYGTDDRFHTGAVPQLAAANWLASAAYLKEEYPNAVLLDVGSTTADIIPLCRFADLKGLTDLMRLQNGYLVYSGMLRGNIATLLQSVVLDGIPTIDKFRIFCDKCRCPPCTGAYHPGRIYLRYTGPQRKDPGCFPQKTRPGCLCRS